MTEEVLIIKPKELPLLKKAIAKNLYSKGVEQSRIAKFLEISQPMVSNYCNCKDKIAEEILKIAENISEKIDEIDRLNFHVCISFSDKEFKGRFFIADKNEIVYDENNKIVDKLTEAFYLLKGKDLNGLIPEVKINIAMAKEKAQSKDDVAAFLNGLIIADGKVVSHNGIRFGSSKHLSSLLLYLKERMDVKAIMNIAYVKDVEKIGLKVGFLTRDYKLKESKKEFDVLMHNGDFGIEPCTYVLGKDAVDVVNKVIKIKEMMT